MHRRMLLIIFSLIILASCQVRTIGVGSWVKKIDSEEASRLMLNFAAKMKREKRLDLEDSRLVYNDYIRKWYIEFSSQRLVTVCEARLLIVEVVEEFLYRLNNHAVLSFELQNFPFTAANLDIKINFESYHGLYVDPLYVGQIWLKCGCVYMYAFDRKQDLIDWSHDRWEPYFKSRELALLKKEADIPPMDGLSASSALLYERYAPPPVVPAPIFAPVESPIVSPVIPAEPVGPIIPAAPASSSSIISPRPPPPATGIPPIPIISSTSGSITTTPTAPPVVLPQGTPYPQTTVGPTIVTPTTTYTPPQPTYMQQQQQLQQQQQQQQLQMHEQQLLQQQQPIPTPAGAFQQSAPASQNNVYSAPNVTPEPAIAPVPDIVQPSFTPDNVQTGN